jgi:hypothetical protein
MLLAAGVHSEHSTPTHAQVYSDPRNVDDDLVTSIVQPAESSGNAPEVFRRIITGSGESINRLLRRTRAPLLLLWGDKVRFLTC